MKFPITATAIALLAIIIASAAPAFNSTHQITKRADSCLIYILTKYNSLTSGKDFSPNMGIVLGPRYLQFQMVIGPNKCSSWINVLWGQNAQVVNLPEMTVAYNTNNMEVTHYCQRKGLQAQNPECRWFQHRVRCHRYSRVMGLHVCPPIDRETKNKTIFFSFSVCLR